MTSKELVLEKDGEVVCDSRVVAEKFKMRHIDVMRKIEKLIKEIAEINTGKFTTLKFEKQETSYRGTLYDYYEMNRPAFSLLVMSFVSKKALSWKIKFNDAFYIMENELVSRKYSEHLNQQSEMWLAQRQQAKLVRREETDVIKQFVEYATKQGSTKAPFYYKHITNATYKCLGLIQHKQPKIRETLDLMQTNQLIMAEMVARKSLLNRMAEGEHYRTIFTLVKQDLEQFADSFLMQKIT